MSDTWSRLQLAAYIRTPPLLRTAVVRALTPSFRVGALAVLRRPDGRVLLVDQPYVEGWSLPGGDLKRGESVQDGLRREVREEVGLQLAVPVPVLACQRPEDRWVTFVVLIDVTEQEAAAATPRSAEIRELGWFETDGLPVLHDDAVRPVELALRGG